ncbi:6-phosphogluconolactonase [secondary endosymbiont of Ctenarytaina eucalypti]|uniref:6-phosphogluconolactonase n=1 Tax=secondary endosymbiont of Ctenarytaina eucalypti TaxID=1199245 RepID=J3VRJ1_9ENTR|nr:6-phosphogluconolactonase [secondary endosymbiont of Ctenarytaina eucalypti]AFP84576.1 3-carboxymuconate cyclase [secondary endosymbiont of Ctenarytaina eucalypti]
MQHIVYVASPESQQIHVWHMDCHGALTLLQVMDTPGQGQPMAIHPANTHLYIGVRPDFGVISYRIDEQALLTKAGMAPLPGSPTQLTTNFQGTMLYCVSYTGNCLSVSPINTQGVVNAPQQTIQGLTSCHSANVDTTNQWLWVPCLHEDRIRLYMISESGYLSPFNPAALESTPGTGPRHMTFHPSGNYAYVINELSGTVNVIAINAINSNPRIVQTADMLARSISDTRWAADIHITPDGRWLYCCDRISSVISRFEISENGSALTLLGAQETETQPRGFNIDSQGRFLVAAGQKSHHIAVYAIDRRHGGLTPLARYMVGKGPMWVSILAKQQELAFYPDSSSRD